VRTSPYAAVRKAVTSVATRYLRQQENIRSIRTGRYADFLVVDGDPLRDPRELRRLNTVYRGGIGYHPEVLLAQVPKPKSTTGQTT
jgi:imidazolonepropionase-like amidohydrolase